MADCVKKSLKVQMGNQKPYFAEGQTMQLPKINGGKGKQLSRKLKIEQHEPH